MNEETAGDKWIIKYQNKVFYERVEGGWQVSDKKGKVLATGTTLEQCFINASKKKGWGTEGA